MINIGIKGYEVLEHKCKPGGGVWVRVRPENELQRSCPHCGAGQVHSKGLYEKTVRHLSSFGLMSHLVVHTRRYQCKACGRSHVPELPGLRKWYRFSEPYREMIYQQHEDGICASRLAWREKIGAATVARIYEAYTARKAKERQRLECPRMLGIDEHTLHRNGTYVTTLCDLKNHKVFDVAQGRSGSELAHYLKGLKGREKVRLICIDLSHPYRAMIRKWFPRARIVADRFHAVRIVMYHFLDQIKELVPQIKYQRRYIRALRKRPEKLSANQKEALQELFERHHFVKILYDEMRQICDLFNKKGQSKRSCRTLAQDLFRHISQLRHTNWDKLHTLANTLEDWDEQIACMWRFSKNNSITEGFHRKMKLIQRRAYGFRNFNNYRLRVIAQCG